MRTPATLISLALFVASVPAFAEDEAADRAAIHALLVEYGRTIDARDFDGFGALFAKDGVYVTGPREASGPEAGANLAQTFAENRLGLAEPNFHVFFNEVITLTGPDSATATSKSFFVAPGEDGAPKPVLMAEYHDDIVREAGAWKFARREVYGLIPAPPKP